MDPPPLHPQQPPTQPHPTAAAATTATTSATYSESLDSSPRTTDSYYDDPPPTPAAAAQQLTATATMASASKLRFMCSYGGHIVPRPHDKSLCYIGGDTRIIVVDRHNVSLSSLTTRLSHSILNGRDFTLKYQLPNEDLDSLITVFTEEDLENMIEEYDRTAANLSSVNSKSSRIRLFLFPLKPESTQSLGPIIESGLKNEDWFVTALNGGGSGDSGGVNAVNGLLLNRGFSDSASVNCLLGLDDDDNNDGRLNRNNNNSNLDLAGVGTGGGGEDAVGGGGKSGRMNMKGGQGQDGQDIHSVPDSPMMETSSSFGSTSSSPSLANLPPIRVHADDQKVGVVGIEEQFAQISVTTGPSGGVGVPVSGVLGIPPQMVVGGDYTNRVFSDDDRSDHGVPVGAVYRNPMPTQLQQQHTVVQSQQQKLSGGGSGGGGAIDLPSPDSVSRYNFVLVSCILIDFFLM